MQFVSSVESLVGIELDKLGWSGMLPEVVGQSCWSLSTGVAASHQICQQLSGLASGHTFLPESFMVGVDKVHQ